MTLEDVTEGIFQEKGDLSQAFEHFDRNEENPDGSNSIDQNSNLKEMDAQSMVRIDCLKRMGVFPDIGLTNQMKLLKKSVGGWHIHQKVAIAQGQREHQSGQGFMGKLGGLFTPKG